MVSTQTIGKSNHSAGTHHPYMLYIIYLTDIEHSSMHRKLRRYGAIDKEHKQLRKEKAQ